MTFEEFKNRCHPARKLQLILEELRACDEYTVSNDELNTPRTEDVQTIYRQMVKSNQNPKSFMTQRDYAKYIAKNQDIISKSRQQQRTNRLFAKKQEEPNTTPSQTPNKIFGLYRSLRNFTKQRMEEDVEQERANYRRLLKRQARELDREADLSGLRGMIHPKEAEAANIRRNLRREMRTQGYGSDEITRLVPQKTKCVVAEHPIYELSAVTYDRIDGRLAAGSARRSDPEVKRVQQEYEKGKNIEVDEGLLIEITEGAGSRFRKRLRRDAEEKEWTKDWEDENPNDINDRFQRKYKAIRLNHGKTLPGVDITVSPNVNATAKNKEDGERQTAYNIANHRRIARKVFGTFHKKNGEEGGHSIPPSDPKNMGDGTYVAKDGKMYPEKSFTVNAAGLTSRQGRNLARMFKTAFNQEATKMDDKNIRRVNSKRNPYRMDTETNFIYEE